MQDGLNFRIKGLCSEYCDFGKYCYISENIRTGLDFAHIFRAPAEIGKSHAVKDIRKTTRLASTRNRQKVPF